MKKITSYLVFGICLLMAFCSCKKDPSELILGRWALDVDQSINHEMLTSPNGSYDETYTARESGIDSAFYTFTDDGKVRVESYYSYNESYVDILTYTLEDGILHMEYEPDNEQEWYDVVTLDAENLVLEGHDSQTYEEDYYEWSIHFVMKKVD